MRDSFVFYRSFANAIRSLPKKERLALVEAVMDLALDGVETELTGVAYGMMELIKPQIIANNLRYENGTKGGRPKKTIGFEKGDSLENQNVTKTKPNEIVNENVNENVVKEKTKREVFSKPTIEDITSYCRERNNNVDPQKFYDFYESKGWMVGKNKMKDWKACVRTWERNSPIAKASDYEEVLPNWMTQQEEELPEWMTPEMREEWQKMKTSKKQTTS